MALLGGEVQREGLTDARRRDHVPPGVVILSGGQSDRWVEALLEFALGVALLEALEAGAILLATDSAAIACGTWYLDAEAEEVSGGAGWLPGAVVLTAREDPADYEAIRTLLSRDEPLYALSLRGERLFALGPEGEVELWGTESPTLLLGRGWQSPSEVGS
jgi:hypothetical protein